MSYENFTLEEKGNITVLTINRPPANSWNLAAMTEMEQILDKLEGDKNVRVVILTGAGGKCFSAGFDVSDAANADKTSPLGQKLWRRVDRMSKPVIAAINGHALGGGCELALSCHFRIMAQSPKIKIGLTELNLGIIPGWGGTQRLARTVGRAKALDMIMFSKRLEAQEAFDIGLVNQVSEPDKLMDDAMEMAEVLAQRPPLAVKAVLEAMAAGMYEGLDPGLDKELEGSKMVGQSADATEGFTAFFEKRPPVFKGE